MRRCCTVCLLLFVTGLALGCVQSGSQPVGVPCAGPGGPSVIARVRTPDGRPAARGATLVLRDRFFTDSAGPTSSADGLTLGAGNRRIGRYQVTVSKPSYLPVVLESVAATGGACGVDVPTVVDVTLNLRPDAPPVRTVVAYPPAMGLGLAGLTVQMTAYVDVQPGIDTNVSWSISDATVATLSTGGFLRAACRTADGSATITARSRYDPTQHARAYLTVWRNASTC